MNHKNWTFHSRLKMRPCDHYCNFDETFFFWIETCHFAVDPDQILV